jgi:hypothetical protein
MATDIVRTCNLRIKEIDDVGVGRNSVYLCGSPKVKVRQRCLDTLIYIWYYFYFFFFAFSIGTI